MCAKGLLQHPNRTILYLDTKGDFDPAHLHWLLENEFQNEPNSELTASCLRRIRVVSVPTIDLLTETLVRTRILLACKLEPGCSNGHDQSSGDLSPRMFFENMIMIVVDSLATPFVPYMGPLPQLAKSQLSVVSFELSRIANVLHCAVLVVNHSRSSKLADQKGFTEERRNLGCLGFSWAAVPHKRLVLTLSNERAPNSERKLHVLIKLSKDANSQIPCPCEDTTFSSCIVKFPS
ncbi:hypothetical protein FBUS_04861 [Fasciolopsis buskii]|uniref:RecA family profile 1 domain-containing protein n=1 Tax=Fasciolopsis buskii TaxID=27845 RepID=A0A8E0S1D6_9TREM|nr:hypothetical protein FBUS_04861 [Fasciolopsis buski]